MAPLNIPDRAERSDCDCMRAAVSVAYGVPYSETPPAPFEFGPTMEEMGWTAWAVERDLRWCWSWDAAPIFMERWIACVDGLGPNGRRGEGVLHAVVMEHDRLLYEPTEDRGPVYHAVNPADVRRAMWLTPADAPDRFQGRCWAIPNPGRDRAGPGVHRHTPSEPAPEPPPIRGAARAARRRAERERRGERVTTRGAPACAPPRSPPEGD